jgi:hypothetical protein
LYGLKDFGDNHLACRKSPEQSAEVILPEFMVLHRTTEKAIGIKDGKGCHMGKLFSIVGYLSQCAGGG